MYYKNEGFCSENITLIFILKYYIFIYINIKHIYIGYYYIVLLYYTITIWDGRKKAIGYENYV